MSPCHSLLDRRGRLLSCIYAYDHGQRFLQLNRVSGSVNTVNALCYFLIQNQKTSAFQFLYSIRVRFPAVVPRNKLALYCCNTSPIQPVVYYYCDRTVSNTNGLVRIAGSENTPLSVTADTLIDDRKKSIFLLKAGRRRN